MKLRQVSATTFHNTGLAASTGYVYTVQAVDAAGNRSAQSSRTKATTLAAPDREAPSTPADLSARPVSGSEIDLAWPASTDNVGVIWYVVYRNKVAVKTAPGTMTSFQDTGLDLSTT